jgi:uncharacterized protein YoaH (UPF0181 family)
MSRMRPELQFLRAANALFREGCDKHALKKEGKLKDSAFLFSFSQKQNQLSLSDNFCSWARKKGLHIKLIKDITAEMWNEFLEDKAEVSSHATLENYISRILKWERVINAFHNADVQWKGKVVMPTKLTDEDQAILRIQQLKLEDYSRLVEYGEKTGTRSCGHVALQISRKIGARVCGFKKLTADEVQFGDGRWGFGTVGLLEKGKRYRRVDITCQEDADFFRSLLIGKQPKDRLIPIQPASVNQYVNRTMHALDMKEDYPETSIHSVRKLYAQELFYKVRREGMSVEEAIQFVNEQLGHGALRDKRLLGIYCKDLT